MEAAAVDAPVPERREIPRLGLSATEARFVSAKMVREWVRAEIVESCIGRLYKIGQGDEKFDVPTAIGTVITIPAAAGDQIRALSKLVDVGVPSQIGLVDDDGVTLPGVFALGPLDLDAARREAQGDRYVPPPAPPVGSIGAAIDGALGADPALDSMDDRIARGEFEAVEIEEGIGSVSDRDSEDQAPAPIQPTLTLEQIILAKRRARRKPTTNGDKK